MIARKAPAGHWLSAPAPGGQPVPLADPAAGVEALAALLAEMVELTRCGAVYPGHLTVIAEQAQRDESVRRALRGQR